MQTNQLKQTSYMRELDRWTETEVIEVLSRALQPGLTDEAVEIVSDLVKKAVRAKVLDSYRNGQASPAAKSINRKRYGKR